MSDNIKLIFYLILLVLLLFYAGKMAWKYSIHFISPREKRGLSDWTYGKKRVAMVASTCFVVFFFYDMLFLDPLDKKMKPENEKNITVSDTTFDTQSKNVLNQKKTKRQLTNNDTLKVKPIAIDDKSAKTDSNIICTDTTVNIN